MKKQAGFHQSGYYPNNGANGTRNGKAYGRTAKKNASLPPRLRVLLTVLCAAVFVVCVYLLIDYYASVQRAKQATADLREIYDASQPSGDTAVPSPSPEATAEEETASATEPAPDETTVLSAQIEETDAADLPSLAPVVTTAPSFAALWPSQYKDNPQLLIDESFQKLRQQNKDIVGWLTIEDVLDEPVLQRDNAFYLTHDSTGAENVTGALFMDENCNLRKLTPNLLIHGHNMKEGAMFGCLKKYKVKDASFYKSHPYITFNTLYEKARYVIFAVAEVNIQPSAHYYLPFWRYLSFTTESELNDYLSMLKELSHFQTQVDVQPGDRLLTLATCTGDDKDTRLLVVARMLRENEDSIKLNQGILSTQVK